MGTGYAVTVIASPHEIDAAALTELVQATLTQISRTFSTYDPTSELSRLNRRASLQWTAVSPAFLEVLELARAVSRLTGGAFEPTVQPLVELWGFGASGQPRRVPSTQEVADARTKTGIAKLETKRHPPRMRKRDPRLSLDLNGIAKGFAVDEIAHRLEKSGVRRYLVDIGGEIRVAGKAPRGMPWRIGIERPSNATPGGPITLQLVQGAVATSGDYRNFFSVDDQRYSHLIDPKTGYPVRHGLVSVTVLHEQTAIADALATGLLVLGPQRGLALATTLDLPAYFIVRAEEAWRIEATERLTPFLNRYGAAVVPTNATVATGSPTPPARSTH